MFSDCAFCAFDDVVSCKCHWFIASCVTHIMMTLDEVVFLNYSGE